MLISICIVTCNRAGILKKCLNQLTAQFPVDDSVEIVVVDNNSTDETKDVVFTYKNSGKSPWPIRYFFEKRQGISHARNRALLSTDGHVIFVDDDVMVEPTWLKELLAVFNKQGVHIAGGRVKLKWPRKHPHWYIPAVMDSGLGKFSPGPTAMPYFIPAAINLALKREIIRQVGLFDTRIAPVSGSTRFFAWGEDYDYVRRAIKAGANCWYVPKAVVFHLVRKCAFDYTYHFKRFREQGRVSALMKLRHESIVNGIASGSALFAKILPHAALAVMRNEPHGLKHRLRLQFAFGYIEGSICALSNWNQWK
jgi:GT2 family glycosyltransferase